VLKSTEVQFKKAGEYKREKKTCQKKKQLLTGSESKEEKLSEEGSTSAKFRKSFLRSS
jgi:hypothetical protein